MNLEDRLYSSTEVAEILGVSLRSVYRYLDDGKILADIKTATGRHRFSKKNIEDFLYPNENNSYHAPVRSDNSETKSQKSSSAFKSMETKSEPRASETPKKAAATEPEDEETGYIDWLEKFRAAREQLSKTKEAPVPITVPVENKTAPEPAVVAPSVSPFAPVQPAPVAPQPEPTPVYKYEKPVEPVQAPQAPAPAPIASVSEPAPVVAPPTPAAPVVKPVEPQPEPVVVPTPPKAPEETEGFFYYTSAITNLKDLAHSLHKFASSSLTPYAFTAYAGMSLYKSIKPFSVLHVYIKPEHKSFFEKVLQLLPSDKNSAQLCLIATSDSFVFDTMKEMHGLKVVSLVKLKKDLLEIGEDALASDLDTLQG